MVETVFNSHLRKRHNWLLQRVGLTAWHQHLVTKSLGHCREMMIIKVRKL